MRKVDKTNIYEHSHTLITIKKYVLYVSYCEVINEEESKTKHFRIHKKIFNTRTLQLKHNKDNVVVSKREF